MINALHLIWILPTAVLFGFMLGAILSANKR